MAAGLFVGLLGAGVLLGWSLGLETLKNPAHINSMKANTALCFVLAGAALVCARRETPAKIVRIGLSSAAVGIAALSVIEYLAGRNLGIDQLLFVETQSSFTPAGRMALATAASVILLGASIATIDLRALGGRRPAEWAAVAAMLPPLVGAADYTVDWRPGLTGMAIHTVVGLLALTAGVLAARPEDGWMRVISSRLGGGAAARRLLPLALGVPLLAVAVRWWARKTGSHDLEWTIVVITVNTIVFLAIAIWWSASRLDQLEVERMAERERAGQELRRVNRALAAINHCRQAMVRAESEQELLDQVCEIIVKDGGHSMAWVGYAQHDADKTVRLVAHRGIAEDYARGAQIRWDESERGRGPTGTAIRTGKSAVCHDVATDGIFSPWRQMAQQYGLRSSVVFPLSEAGKPFGAISIYSSDPEAFHEEERDLLARLAEDLAYGIVVQRAQVERERALAAVQYEQDRYRSLTVATAQVVWFTNAVGEVVTDMPMWRDFTGMTVEEIQGWGWIESVHADDRARTAEVWRAALDGRALYEIEYRLRRHDGEYRDVWVRGVPILGPDGSIREWVGTCTDITERKRAVEKVRQASLYARNLLEASLDPLVTISKDGRIMDANRAAEQVTGYDREQLIGSDFCSYFTDSAKAREGYQRVFAEGSVRDYPLAIRHLSGPVTEVLYNATVYRKADGEIEGVFAAARDVTERKRAEEALAHRTAELERSNRELQDFASIASHDLQEPLRKVTAFGDRLRERLGDALDDVGNDYLLRMQNAASRMSSLLESLLEYSRVTTKAKPFEDVDLNSITADVLTDLETRIQESGARVEVGTLPRVYADKLQMRQLMQNLLANALKFHDANKPPRVKVSAVRVAGGGWSIAVQDEGVGFEQEYADRIFRPFQRLHGRNEFPGSGMGLAICRKIVDRHGGTIDARSHPGAGSAFTVTLPPKQATGVEETEMVECAAK